MRPGEVVVAVAVNNPDNGHFIGRCYGVKYNDMDLTPEYIDHGPRFEYLGDGRFRFSRRTFKCRTVQGWYGNWCWDGLYMQRSEARRLLRYMREGKWNCEAGPTRLFNWFRNALPVG